MRFAGNTSNVGSWIQAGKAASQGASDFFKVARANSPDYGGLAEIAMKARSSERIAATQAEAQVAQAGLRAKAKMVETKNNVKAGEKINDMKVGAKRMAGVVGALGAVAGGAFMGIENRRADKRQAERDAIDEQRWKQRLAIMEKGIDRDTKPTEKPEPFTPEPFDPNRDYTEQPLGGLPPVTSDGVPPADPVDQQTGDGVQPATTQPVVSRQVSSGNIRQDVYTYLTVDKGMEKNTALGLMANIDRESGFRPGIASGDDGGPGGLFQWKGVRQTPQVASLVKAGDWKGQIDYALTEPENLSLVKPGSFQSMSFQTPQAAADWFMNNWERPGDRQGASRKHTQFLGGYNF